MTTHRVATTRLFSILCASALGSFLVGCGPAGRYAVRSPSGSPVEAGQRLPLRVELRAEKEYSNYSTKRWFGGIREIEIDFGDALTSGAETTARSVFDQVVTAVEPAQEGGQGVDAALALRLALISWFRGTTLGSPMETVIDLEWRLAIPSSEDLLWAGTARGVGKGTMNTIQEQLDTALEEAFLESVRQMAASPEIRAFADGVAARKR